jgi:hypothetical protein
VHRYACIHAPLIKGSIEGVRTKCPRFAEKWLEYTYGDGFREAPVFSLGGSLRLQIGMHVLLVVLVVLVGLSRGRSICWRGLACSKCCSKFIFTRIVLICRCCCRLCSCFWRREVGYEAVGATNHNTKLKGGLRSGNRNQNGLQS